MTPVSGRTIPVTAIVVGIALVIAGALADLATALRVVLVLVGIVVALVPQFGGEAPRHDVRRFLTLRREVDDFIGTVRRLSSLSATLQREDTPELRAEFERGCEELVARAEHIGQLAWRAHAELAEAAAPPAPAGGSDAPR